MSHRTRASQPIEPIFAEPKPPSRVGRKSAALEAIREATPPKDLHDVSTYLKHPISPAESTPAQSPQRAEPVPTPSSLPPLPPSPASPAKSIVQNLKAADVSAIVQDIKQHDVIQSGKESLVAIRQVCFILCHSDSMSYTKSSSYQTRAIL